MARLDWLRVVRDDGEHNAVTDLARWRGSHYLCFRRAHNHFNVPPGDVHVVRSEDLERWRDCAHIDTGLDDRDPKLVADEGRLWLFFGAARLELAADGRPLEGGRRWIESQVSWTEDGLSWESARPIYRPGWWLWRPTRVAGTFWCPAYGRDLDEEPPRVRVDLLRSDDGIDWRRHTTLVGGGRGNESALFALADKRLAVLVRGVADETLLLSADPPYERWREQRIGHWMQAPAVARVAGRLIVAGRDRLGDDYVTRLWQLEGARTRHLLDLPSGGDTSYCGLVPDGEGALLVSYYSQHEFRGRPDYRICEKPAAVYLARVQL